MDLKYNPWLMNLFNLRSIWNLEIPKNIRIRIDNKTLMIYSQNRIDNVPNPEKEFVSSYPNYIN